MRLPLIALACLLLLAGPALASERREVKDRNLAWTLPSAHWSFVEPGAPEKENGYVLGAQHAGGGVRAWARVTPAEGLAAKDLAEEIRDGTTKGLSKQAQAQVMDGRLSGLAGSAVLVSGEQGGVPYTMRAWVILQGGTLHALIVDVFHGADKDLGSEIDALRRGYRLLAGAGPEEAPAAGQTPVEGGGADLQGEAFPPLGPKREGRTVVFPSHNLRWTLPEGSPYAWTKATDDEKKVGQVLLQAKAGMERKAEGADEPKVTSSQVLLVVGPRTAGATPSGIVNNSGVHEHFIKTVFGKTPVDASKTKIDPDRKVGNMQGASFMLVGGQGKTVACFIFVTVMLRDRTYEWHVVVEGGKDVLSTWGKHVGGLFEGVEFPNTVEPVSGPVGVAGIGALPSSRGHSGDKEVEQAFAGGTAKKPKGVLSVPWESGEAAQRLAWEARSPDGLAYVFFDVRGWSSSDRQVAARKLEEWVTEREGEWKGVAGSDALTVTKGKEAWQDGAFAGAKGVTYRFTGSTPGGEPLVEQGWVVRAKGSVLFLRAQFGGQDAEKVMDAAWKSMRKGIKIN